MLIESDENRASFQDRPAASDLFCLFNIICHDYYNSGLHLASAGLHKQCTLSSPSSLAFALLGKARPAVVEHGLLSTILLYILHDTLDPCAVAGVSDRPPSDEQSWNNLRIIIISVAFTVLRRG